jgi:colicin import membrane protein
VLGQFEKLTQLARDANAETIYQQYAIGQVDAAARSFTESLKKQADARKADADAATAAADAARKAAQESRQRVVDLANAGLSDAEKSRLQLNKDLLAIGIELKAAEEALAAAKRAGDAKSLADARERLRLAGEATKQAKEQDRERQLQALGVDANILKPATTIADQFKAVREAFDRKLIDGGEARNALRELAAEGISIRKEISAELSRPSANALQVADVRTQEGASAMIALASGREDPAIAQRRDQIAKLEEIRRGIVAIGASPVEILGG